MADKLNLIVDVKEKHCVSVMRSEDHGKIDVLWTTIYNTHNGELISVHRYINTTRQGLTEVYDNSRCVAEIVYVNGAYKRMNSRTNSPLMFYADALGRPIDISCLCE